MGEGIGVDGCGRGGTGNGTDGFTIPIGPDCPIGVGGAGGLGDTPITPLTGGVGEIGFGSTLTPGKFGGGPDGVAVEDPRSLCDRDWLAPPLFDNSFTKSSIVDGLF